MTGHRPRRQTPRGPFVLDIRELGRRPGAMRPVRVQVPAAEDMGTPMLWVPAGGPVDLDLRVESVLEGVLVSGTASADLVGECARCLDEVRDGVTVELRELFYYPDRAEEIDDDEEDVLVVVDDHLDLAPVVRDALVLDLPLSPLCDPDCEGLCVDCGARLADVEPNHSHDSADPRWAALSALTEAGTAGDAAARETKEKS
ncbi:YceD family protein [Pseudofrankia sp. DC12]|uniref:YceD family protein n=1 Tax=Pseudofrankia sp. DC12 TaxID=683315 RepID=UPI0005F7C5B4|nr:YceD family protein [Pseudofrankia sp. DC12]